MMSYTRWVRRKQLQITGGNGGADAPRQRDFSNYSGDYFSFQPCFCLFFPCGDWDERLRRPPSGCLPHTQTTASLQAPSMWRDYRARALPASITIYLWINPKFMSMLAGVIQPWFAHFRRKGRNSEREITNWVARCHRQQSRWPTKATET